MAIELGSEAKDRVTGLKGIVIGETRWLYGCLRYTIQPQRLDKDGKQAEATSFDEGQLIVTKTPKQTKIFATSPAATTKTSKEAPGGPRPEPQRRQDPRRR
jgi:hypothetical protein